MRFFKFLSIPALILAQLILPLSAAAQDLPQCVLDVEADFDSIDAAEIDAEGLYVMRDIGIELVRLEPADRGATAHAYLKLINFGELDDHFICAATPYATRVTTTQGDGNIPLTAESELDLSSQDNHFIFEGLIDPIAPGQQIELLLQFDFGGLFKVSLPASAGN